MNTLIVEHFNTLPEFQERWSLPLCPSQRAAPLTPDEVARVTPMTFTVFGDKPLHPCVRSQALLDHAEQRYHAQEEAAHQILRDGQTVDTVEEHAQHVVESFQASVNAGDPEQTHVLAHEKGFADGYSTGAKRGMAEGLSHANAIVARMARLAQAFETVVQHAQIGDMDPTTPRVLHVAPSDLAMVQLYLAPAIAPLGWSLNADLSLAPGQCAVV